MAISVRAALFKKLGRRRGGISSYRPRGIGGVSSRAMTYAKRAASLEDAQWEAAYDDGQVSLDAYLKQLNTRLSRSWLTGTKRFALKRKINTVKREFEDEKFEATLSQQLNSGRISPTQAAAANLQRQKATLGYLDPNSKRYLIQQDKVNDLQRSLDRLRRSDFSRQVANELSKVNMDRPQELLAIIQKFNTLKEDARRTGDFEEALAYETSQNNAMQSYQDAVAAAGAKVESENRKAAGQQFEKALYNKKRNSEALDRNLRIGNFSALLEPGQELTTENVMQNYFDTKYALAESALALVNDRLDSVDLTPSQTRRLENLVQSFTSDIEEFNPERRALKDYEVVQVEKEDIGGNGRVGNLKARFIHPSERFDLERSYVKIGNVWRKIYFEGVVGDDKDRLERVLKKGLQGEGKAVVYVYDRNGNPKKIPIVFEKREGQTLLVPVPVTTILEDNKVKRLVQKEDGTWDYIVVPPEQVNFDEEPVYQKIAGGDDFGEVYSKVNKEQVEDSIKSLIPKSPFDERDIQQEISKLSPEDQAKRLQAKPVGISKIVTTPSGAKLAVPKLPKSKFVSGKGKFPTTITPITTALARPIPISKKKASISKTGEFKIKGKKIKAPKVSIPVVKKPVLGTGKAFSLPAAKPTKVFNVPSVSKPVLAKPKKITPVKTPSAASAAKTLRLGFINKTISLNSAYKKYSGILTPRHIRSIYKSIPVKFS